MYPFVRHEIDWLLIHESRPALGARHLKTCLRATRPAGQSTLNLYIAGRFEWRCGDFAQELGAGQSTLDLRIGTIPAGALIVERPLTEGAVRLCLQARDLAPFTRRRVALSQGETLDAGEGFVVPLSLPSQPVRIFTAASAQDVFVVELSE